MAIADDELIVRLGAIAAPVRNYAGEVIAAVALSADQNVIDVDALEDKLSSHLLATADQISARLGYRHGHEPTHLLSDLYGIAFDEGNAS